MGQSPDEKPESVEGSAKDRELGTPGADKAGDRASSPLASLAPDFTGPLRATGGPVLPNCPPEDEWFHLAADILNKEDSTRLLEHAASCDRCSVLLREAEHMASDQKDPEQERLLSSLSTSNSVDQKRIATRMAQEAAPRSEIIKDQREARRRWFHLPQWRWAMATALVVLAVGSVIGLRLFRREAPETLIARAYTETRTLPTRVPGAHHSAVYQVRGSAGSAFESPLPLLQATADLSAKLRKHPDDPVLLALRGRAELVSGDVPAAIASLERSLELQPSDSAKIDLASALAARAASGQHADDTARAIDLLGDVLRNSPDNEVALFNRAIVEEQARLHQQAIADWQRYLQAHPSGEWADEARQRLTAIQQVSQHSQAQPPLAEQPSAFLHAASSAELDSTERYFDTAMTQWLAAAGSATRDEASLSALRLLASTTNALHGDGWWADVVAGISQSSAGLLKLSAAHRANASGDYRDAAMEAAKAEAEFVDAPAHPVRLAAMYERAHATARLAEQPASCGALHASLSALLENTSSRWLQVQNLLDQAACEARSGDFTRAGTLIRSALKVAREAHYRSLALRAIGFAAANERVLGNSDEAWRLNEEGLLACDTQGCPPVRRYQFEDELSHVAEEEHLPYATNVLLREASDGAAATTYRYAEAVDRQRLARSALELKDVDTARQEFGRANGLFASLPPSPEIKAYRAEGDIALAELEIMAGDLDSAERRLDTQAAVIQQVPNYEVAQKYYRCRSELQLRRGNFTEAEKALLASAAIGDRALSTIKSDADRASWDRESRAAYRDLVDIALHYRRDPSLALGLWEWYKSAPLRAPATSSSGATVQGVAFPRLEDLQLHAPSLDLVTVGPALVYAVLRDGIVLWYVHNGSVTVHKASASPQMIEQAVRKLQRLASDPASDVELIHSEARQLYDWLVLPAQLALPQASNLSIETDGALWQVPFNLLIGPDGKYFGDTQQIVFAQGASPRAFRSAEQVHPSEISRHDRLLVVHSQVNEGGGQGLADVSAEARAVSATFTTARIVDADSSPTLPIADQLRDAAIFHFAGHAIQRADGTALVLGPENRGAAHLLTSAQIDRATMPAGKLVVLAACASELGRSGGAGDSGSLVRAFLRAGIPQVVAAKWPVDSKATSLFMSDFYSRLAAGAPVAAALSQASRTVRDIPHYSHPYYWAAFNAFGQL